MGTQRISITRPKPRRRRSSFQRLFIWYCVGILVATVVITCTLEGALLLWFTVNAKQHAPYLSYQPVELALFFLALALPIPGLIAAILFFAWRMGRKVNRPVGELMVAVEKIRQQDLNFSIRYHERNELGDLCSAFNDLRSELQRSLEREWRKQEEMRTMIAALSHDLRTPVTILQGHIESLVRTEAGEKRNQRLERYLPVLESSSQRMTRLLNDLLLVASLEETSFVIRSQPVHLAAALERKAALYRLQAAAHDITFAYDYEADPALANGTDLVLLDVHRLEQVLDNLFENALRATSARGQISLHCTQQPDRLRFLVRDTGCGIASADLPHVFEKFYHGQARPGEQARQNAGLGLYTCKLLVERQGGVIALQNHPAGGCEVAFSLPVNEASGALADAPGSQPISSLSTAETCEGFPCKGKGNGAVSV
ncbi:MAG TPA: HAMP domain-containing sensor histidine kinase [Ktedonobacterales bacterium]|nr:HAMP domain-containing sensor histidine kinase [Ktedonobacterales bacterium]